MKMRYPLGSFIVTLNCLLAGALHAEVKMPAIFSDHMVLQQEAKLPVWGWADPGEKVAVTFGSAKAEATSGPDGKWRVDLPPVPAGTPPGTLVVAGKNTITISDVLVGEVWLCSGQSNMEYHLGSPGVRPTDTQHVNDSQLRLFHSANFYGDDPRDVVPADDVKGSWQVCSYESPYARDFLWKFSGVGYYFGKNLRTALNRPVGLIESAQGGTSAQAWTSLSALASNPVLSHYADVFKAWAATAPGNNVDFFAKLNGEIAAYQKWAVAVDADPTYKAAMKAWIASAPQVRASGQRPPPQPVPPIPAPVQTLHYLPAGTFMFNSELNPLIPFAIKGVIWYQGEGNAEGPASAFEYRTLLPALITDWRTRWGQGDFPFLIVQLANFGESPKDPVESSNWAILRESQLKTLALPNTGLAVTIDIGNSQEVHYSDKADVGARLALAARHIAYGEKIVYTGPIYDSFTTEGDKIRITFKSPSVGGGLVIGSSPWLDPRATPVSKTKLEGFGIAGEDKNWVSADATIDGNSVVVSSPKVAKPISVRYGWAGGPACNLYNKENLPASPFRTDDWPVVPANLPARVAPARVTTPVSTRPTPDAPRR